MKFWAIDDIIDLTHEPWGFEKINAPHKPFSNFTDIF